MLKPIPDENKVYRKVAIFKQMQLLKVRKSGIYDCWFRENKNFPVFTIISSFWQVLKLKFEFTLHKTNQQMFYYYKDMETILKERKKIGCFPQNLYDGL